jgi:thiamine-monophosphate kinase
MGTERSRTEHELIAAFARAIDAAGVRPPGLVAGVGDDTAVVRPESGKDTLLTQDVQVEGRHFERRWLSGRELGWRLAAVNLSDVAAMGGEPRYALLSIVAPTDVPQSYLLDAVRGVVAHLSQYRAAVVGGNVSSTEGPLVCDMTLTGVVAAGRAWRRRAREGDAIVVAGELGAAAAGLVLLRTMRRVAPGGRLVRAFKRPEPRLDVARLLRSNPAVHGAIDVSDGLSGDLVHVCRAAGLGCEVDGGALPVSRTTELFCRTHGHEPAEWAMRGGEDYALVLAVSPRSAKSVCDRIRTRLEIPARVVGRFTRAKGVYRMTYPDGSVHRFQPGSWDHFA